VARGQVTGHAPNKRNQADVRFWHNADIPARSIEKFGLSPSSARDVVWEMEYDLQQIWAGTISNQYKAITNHFFCLFGITTA
jgi:hypothetical protein